MSHTWRLGHDRGLALDRPRIIAILNVTPDSFFDGSRLTTREAALAAAITAIDAGADMLDIGGESTRPGAVRVSAAEQRERVVPVISAIRALPSPADGIPISIDTTLAEVADAALRAGADAINDVAAGLEDPSMFDVAAAHRAGIILMHRLRRPEDDSYSDQYAEPPRYDSVVHQVREFLRDRVLAALRAGIAREAILLDPGLGFGKTVSQNVDLIRGTGELGALGFPILSALSRKSFVGRIACPHRETTPSERLPGTLALSVMHMLAGARIFRVHDVREHAEALKAAWVMSRPGT